MVSIVLLLAGSGLGYFYLAGEAGADGSTLKGAQVSAAAATSGDATATALGRLATAAAKRAPTRPPVTVCSSPAMVRGPARPPAGAVLVPAGDLSKAKVDLREPGKKFYFAKGVHTFDKSAYSSIIPGAGSSFIGAPGAVLDGQHSNLYAFTGEASNVRIQYLTIRNFGTGASNNDAGVVNHDRGSGWIIANNMITRNDGAAVMLGSRAVLSRNCLKNNGQYGFSALPKGGDAAATGITITQNEVAGNNTDNWEKRRPGCGCTGGGKLWSVDRARVTGNYVHDNKGAGLWADNDNREILFQGNYIADNDKQGIEYEVSYNFAIRNNTLLRNGIPEGRKYTARKDPFPIGAIYISESGGDPRAGGTYATSQITGNVFKDNWDGVVLWENADRFCRPDEEFDSTNGCPWFDRTFGTRYRTQNIRITGNNFSIDKAGLKCSTLCGRQAVFSNFGTYPENSPYKGEVIEQAITFKQNNVWAANTYVGPWAYIPYSVDKLVTTRQWQAAPYAQDKGSAFR